MIHAIPECPFFSPSTPFAFVYCRGRARTLALMMRWKSQRRSLQVIMCHLFCYTTTQSFPSVFSYPCMFCCLCFIWPNHVVGAFVFTIPSQLTSRHFEPQKAAKHPQFFQFYGYQNILPLLESGFPLPWTDLFSTRGDVECHLRI